jgi:ubiquinone/menaquinone biosynthesis C-methylase UbiE
MQENVAQAVHRQGEIEEVLRRHPGVKETAVVYCGRDGLAVFVVPDELYMDEVAGRRVAGSTALGKWQKTFDLSQLSKAASTAPVGFNTIGWNSSYTRQPIPVDQIREWVEATVTDVLQFAPRAVYEIGCGTGMLLMRIVPHCDRYVAVDFSSIVLNRLKEQLRTVPSVAERVEVMERKADNFDGLVENSFDAVVLNSVAQYFPNAAYLTRVLEGAVRIVKPGGHIFVGDNRSLPLLSAFASSIEVFQAGDEMSSSEMRDRIRRHIEREQELVLSPAYFLSLRLQFPDISRVEIRPLRGRSDNEMTRYRYEAILHVGHETIAPPVDEFQDWQVRGFSLDAIRSILQQNPNKRIGIQRIRNTRVEKDLAGLASLRDPQISLTAGELRHNLEQNVVGGIHPQTLMDLEGEGLGFKVFLSCAASRSDGSYDACFIPVGSLQETACPVIGWPEPEAFEFARLSNAPGQRKLRVELINQLVAHCSQNLPQELAPREIALVDALARTADGNIDPSTLLALLPIS